MDQRVIPRIRQQTLSDYWVDRCRQYGIQAAAGYASGRKSSAMSMYGVELDPVKQAFWKMGEVAACLEFGLDPETALDWSDKPDDGYDLVLGSHHIDVKTVEERMRLMLWPATKTDFDFYRRKKFHWFVLVKGDGPSFTISKCIDKWGFYSMKSVATAGNTKLEEGTWFMEQKHLWDIEFLCRIVGHP
jgi:hypothetical protein